MDSRQKFKLGVAYSEAKQIFCPVCGTCVYFPEEKVNPCEHVLYGIADIVDNPDIWFCEELADIGNAKLRRVKNKDGFVRAMSNYFYEHGGYDSYVGVLTVKIGIADSGHPLGRESFAYFAFDFNR